MEDRVWVHDPATGRPVEYIRSDLWPVDVAHGIHIAGVTWGLSECIAGVVTAIDSGGNVFAQLLPPHHLEWVAGSWLGTYQYDSSGVRAYGWHRPAECPRRPYR